jgi:hypothetical protein
MVVYKTEEKEKARVCWVEFSGENNIIIESEDA